MATATPQSSGQHRKRVGDTAAGASLVNQLGWLLACDHYSIDVHRKPTLIGVFDEFRFKAVPTNVTRFFIVGYIKNLQGNKIRIFLERPNGLNVEMAVVAVPEEPTRAVRFAIELGNLILSEEGVHRFEVRVDDFVAGELSLPVVVEKG